MLARVSTNIQANAVINRRKYGKDVQICFQGYTPSEHK